MDLAQSHTKVAPHSAADTRRGQHCLMTFRLALMTTVQHVRRRPTTLCAEKDCIDYLPSCRQCPVAKPHGTVVIVSSGQRREGEVGRDNTIGTYSYVTACSCLTTNFLKKKLRKYVTHVFFWILFLIVHGLNLFGGHCIFARQNVIATRPKHTIEPHTNWQVTHCGNMTVIF